jgi:hypothetical protein
MLDDFLFYIQKDAPEVWGEKKDMVIDFIQGGRTIIIGGGSLVEGYRQLGPEKLETSSSISDIAATAEALSKSLMRFAFQLSERFRLFAKQQVDWLTRAMVVLEELPQAWKQLEIDSLELRISAAKDSETLAVTQTTTTTTFQPQEPLTPEELDNLIEEIQGDEQKKRRVQPKTGKKNRNRKAHKNVEVKEAKDIKGEKVSAREDELILDSPTVDDAEGKWEEVPIGKSKVKKSRPNKKKSGNVKEFPAPEDAVQKVVPVESIEVLEKRVEPEITSSLETSPTDGSFMIQTVSNDSEYAQASMVDVNTGESSENEMPKIESREDSSLRNTESSSQGQTTRSTESEESESIPGMEAKAKVSKPLRADAESFNFPFIVHRPTAEYLARDLWNVASNNDFGFEMMWALGASIRVHAPDQRTQELMTRYERKLMKARAVMRDLLDINSEMIQHMNSLPGLLVPAPRIQGPIAWLVGQPGAEASLSDADASENDGIYFAQTF